MGGNQSYIYGARHGESYTQQSFASEGEPAGPVETKVQWPNAIKIVSEPLDGDVVLSVIVCDQETGLLQEVNLPDQQITRLNAVLDEKGMERLINDLQHHARKVWGKKPW